MQAVNQAGGVIENAETRPFGQVRKGFTYFAEGDVIFAKITPCMQNGKSAVARGLSNGLGFGSTEFHVIRPNTDRVLAEWIWNFVRQGSFRREGTRNFRGAVGQQRVPADYLSNAIVPLPCLEEQHRIVARIKECLGRMQDIEQLRQDVAKEQNGVLASARHEAFSLDAPLCQFEAILSDGPTNGLYKHARFYGTGARILRIDNFSGGEVFHDGGELRRLIVNEAELRRYSLQVGDIVLNRVNGSLDVVGKACLIASLSEETVFESNMMRFVVDTDKAVHRYVLHFLSSPNCRDQIKSKAKVIQQASINQKDVTSLVLPLPHVAEQSRIADRLDKIRAVVEGFRANTADQESSTSMLRESILRKAFAGEL